MVLTFILLSIIVLIFFLWCTFLIVPRIGKKYSAEESTKRYSRHDYFKEGVFKPFEMLPMTPSFSLVFKFFKKKVQSKNEKPSFVLETFPIKAERKGEVDYTWFGHSSILFRSAKLNVLIDPVFSGYASPLPFIAKQFPYSHFYNPKDLPPIDVLIISHSHYDHLDYDVIRYYKDKVKAIVTSLGVSSHLIKWGVSPDIIHEVAWNESFEYDNVRFNAHPAKHFSGRFINDKDTSLWSSWLIEMAGKKLYYSSDSGYGDFFKSIGEKYGEVDFAAIECGAYDELWPDVHMFPSETLKVAKDVKAKLFTPVHWGKFALGIHPWNASPKELLATMKLDPQATPAVTFPRIGQTISIDEKLSNPWWQ